MNAETHPFIKPTVEEQNAIPADHRATDIAAAARFAEENAEQLKYCHQIGWLVWDGKRWAEDRSGQVAELAKQSARKWTRLWEQSNHEDRERRVRQALSFESYQHIRSVLKLSESDPRLVVAAECLDSHPWLLNVLNGTLNLRTGQLRAPRREDLMTKMASVEYRPATTHPMLERYLGTIEQASPGLTAFLARVFGTCLTGDASAESIFLLSGEGGSGKTTLVEAMAALLSGDYAVKLAFSSLCWSRNGRGQGAASPDLLALRGKRFAYADEGDQSARLDAGIVKEITGNGALTARALYNNPLTFRQNAKLCLSSNFEPRVEADDSGMWRRMMKVPFQALPESQRDHHLKRALMEEPIARSALLNWCVNGCLDWQSLGGGRNGLNPPAIVVKATDEYRAKQDTHGAYWDELSGECILGHALFTSSASLRRHYEGWCQSEGHAPADPKRFAAFLSSKGLVRTKSDGARGWRGIKLLLDGMS